MGKNQKVEQMMILNSRGDMVNGDCDLNHGSESLQGRHRSPWQAGGKRWLQNVRHTLGQGILRLRFLNKVDEKWQGCQFESR